MALEDKIQELIDAVNRNTAVTESLMNLRAEAIEKVKGEAAPASKKATAKAEEKAPVKEERQITDSPEDRKPADEAADTGADTSAYEALGAKIKEYVGFDDDADRRKARQENVKKIFGHDKIKAKKHTEVPEGMIATVIKNIDKLLVKAQEEAAAAAGSDDDDDLVG